MGIIQSRIPVSYGFSSPQEAVRIIQTLYEKKGFSIALMDAIDESVRTFPSLAPQFLVLAYDIYATQKGGSRYHLYQNRIFDFGISSGDKVLDMGSGHNPFPLATHLADIAVSDNSIGRGGVPFKYVDGKPVFECSVEKTPFADKEFDFVYCSHVLEHAENPEVACNELMRIGKRGYIETPTKGKDVFLCYAKGSHHESYVELINGVLTFCKYEDWEKDGIGFSILPKMIFHPETEREKIFSALTYLRPRAINTMLLWDKCFNFSVIK